MMSNPISSHDPSQAHAQSHHDDGRVHAHISSWQFLTAIFGLLIVLTVITVAVSYVDLGPLNTIVAVLVATMKASVVALFFMHLRHDKLFHGVVFIASFVFLGIFLMFTLDDRNTRGQVDEANGSTVLPADGTAAAGGMPERPAVAGGGAGGTHATGQSHVQPAHGGSGSGH